MALFLTVALPTYQIAWAQEVPAVDQLPVGGNIVAGEAAISQTSGQMTVNQSTERAVIDWQSFNIGSDAGVTFNQPSANSVALNRVLDGDPTQIFGHLTANGQVFLTNGAGVYFAPNASVSVGSFVAAAAAISNENFMAGQYIFDRNGATGAVINAGSIAAGLGGYVALLAPEVRNQGIVVAQLGTVAMAAGENYQLQFDEQGSLADITVSKSDVAALVENRQAVAAPGGLIILSAQAANHLQGGIVKNSGTIEASGMVDDGGVVRLVASDMIELAGEVTADAAADSAGNGGTVTAIADLNNADSSMTFSGTISAQAGANGGNGGAVETSGSNFSLADTAFVSTKAPAGKTGNWLIDPYDYTITASAADSIENSLGSSNVTVTTSANNTDQGSNGISSSPGNITVSSEIDATGSNELTLSAANAITVSAAISTGALTLTGPGGITLNSNLSTLTNMTLDGNVTLGADITLASGTSNTYTAYTDYTVPAGITSLTVTLVGGSGNKGGTDGGDGGDSGSVGVLTAAFTVTPQQHIYIAPGSAGAAGVTGGNTAGGAGGTNAFNLASGGTGGTTGPSGWSGSGSGGGAATILALTSTPDTSSAMLLAGGGGGGGGAGNNSVCPGLCAGQDSANYLSSGMSGQAGYHAGNESSPKGDGGGSGGGGGGLLGGLSNQNIVNSGEWTGRGGNVGQSGAANSFSTTSLSTSLLNRGNNQAGYATVSYGGGLINITGSVDGAHALTVSSPSSNVTIGGAVGGTTPLSSLSITGSSGITLSGGAITTTGTQAYTGPVTLNSATTTITTTNSAVTFGGDIVKASGKTSNLTVSSGSGNVSFNGKTGTSSSSIGALSVTSTGTTSLAGTVYATSLTKSGSGKTTVSGGTVQTTGSQSYAGMLNLSGDTTLRSTGTGNITVSGAIVNDTQSDLTINASGGDVTLSGNLVVGTNDLASPIGDISITASGTVNLGSSETPISGKAKSLAITANTANVYANSTTSFTCGSSVYGLCLTDTSSFNISSASVFSGPLSGTTSLTKSGSGALSMSGVNTYSGATTVSAGKLDITGTGKLGNGDYSGNISVTGQLRFSNSVDQILRGTISGSGFINSPGSGTLTITTLSNADSYNLSNAYVVPTGSGSSSYYGASPSFSYQLATTAAGGTAVTDAEPSGTAVLSGAPTATSVPGSYTISYSSGLTLGSERYNLVTGNNLSWTVAARPLTVTVSKVYDGTASFSSGFSLSGMVNSDAAPTLTGSASASSANAGSYTSFASNTLSINNSNYTLTGATINATISKYVLNLTVSKTYDGSATFSSGFLLSGMLNGDAMPTVSGTASVNNSSAGTYTSLASNNLTLGNPNYTTTGGTVSAEIVPDSPQIPVPVTTQPAMPNTDLSGPLLTLPETQTPAAVDGTTPVPTVSNSFAGENSSGPAAQQNTAGNNPPASSSTPGQNTGTSSATASAQNSIVVSLVQTPSAQADGIVTVSVPQEAMSSSGGFSFKLPTEIAGADGSVITARKMDGQPLPAWLHFDPAQKTFSATSAPAGALPVQLEVLVRSADGQTIRTTIILGTDTN